MVKGWLNVEEKEKSQRFNPRKKIFNSCFNATILELRRIILDCTVN